MIFSFDLDSQPNGGFAEDCLTTFIPNGGNSPKWFDRPCVEKSDSVGDPGHKFMCECDLQNPLGDTFAQPCLQICKYYPNKIKEFNHTEKEEQRGKLTPTVRTASLLASGCGILLIMPHPQTFSFQKA